MGWLVGVEETVTALATGCNLAALMVAPLVRLQDKSKTAANPRIKNLFIFLTFGANKKPRLMPGLGIFYSLLIEFSEHFGQTPG